MGVLQKFWEHLTGKHAEPQRHAFNDEPVRAQPQRLRVYLALQKFADGRVMYRRWSPDGDVPGGPFEARTEEAKSWIARAGGPVWKGARTKVPGVPPFRFEKIERSSV